MINFNRFGDQLLVNFLLISIDLTTNFANSKANFNQFQLILIGLMINFNQFGDKLSDLI